VEYELDCRSGAVGGTCRFEWDDCEGNAQSVVLGADSGYSICALSGSVFVTSTSGAWYEYDQCYYGPYTLEYGSVSPATVCSNFGNNPSGSFYFDVPNFSIASVIYTDLLGNTAPAFFYTDGTEVATVDGGGQVTARQSC
jgi:hypothetical protein